MGIMDTLARSGFNTGQVVRITGEALQPPVTVELGGDLDTISPIDASIAMTQDAGRQLPWELFPHPVLSTSTQSLPPHGPLPPQATADIEAAWNQGKEPVNQARVIRAYHRGQGQVGILRRETPAEVKRRWMETTDSEDNRKSFHSSIVANPDHSQKVTAYDLSVGQAKTIDDRTYYLYLCLVADWRTPWDKPLEIAPDSNREEVDKAVQVYRSESSRFPLIGETLKYWKTGLLPEAALCAIPTLIWSQSSRDRSDGRPPNSGGNAE